MFRRLVLSRADLAMIFSLFRGGKELSLGLSDLKFSRTLLDFEG